MVKKMLWVNQACLKLELNNGKVIYFDPYNIVYNDEADYIFISHSHYDHFNENDIIKIKNDKTIIVASEDCNSDKFNINFKMKPFDNLKIDDLFIKTIPAYNKTKSFHPRSNNWLGYIIDINGFSIYHSGDTDMVDEMKEAEGVALAFVAIGGTYTMNAHTAVEAVNTLIKPKKAVPIHWGSIVGSEHDAQIFVNGVNCESEIL
jgi:L-ascorbate metabolism protein UlaG (beta-lactamase superfamily)